MEMRKAKLKDVDSIADLWTEFMKYHDNLVIPKDPRLKEYLEKKKNSVKAFREFVRACIFSRYALVLVAINRKRIIGYSLSLIKKNIPVFKVEKYGYISDLYIQKKYRGKGISSRFKNESIKWFKKKGLKYVQIMAYNQNDQALNIYRKWGFFDLNTALLKKI